jgi:hypothetical protein
MIHPRPPVSRSLLRALLLPALGCAAALLACGIGIRRDYSTIPAGQVGFDDLCGLQDYFDTIEAKIATAPELNSAVDIEADGSKRVRGGKNRFVFETEFQLKTLRRVLDQNWSNLPEPLAKAERVEIEVHWSEKAGVRRVVTNTDAAIYLPGQPAFPLPYHVCLSEILYGEPLYRQRREMTGGTLPYHSIFADGGIDVGRPDTGAAPATPGADGGPPTSAMPAAPVYDGGPPASLHPTFKSAPPAH